MGIPTSSTSSPRFVWAKPVCVIFIEDVPILACFYTYELIAVAPIVVDLWRSRFEVYFEVNTQVVIALATAEA